ncbi:MAG TPA: hypothetical protein VGV61_01370 [Thermoanaerobaculia bacterium]|jgi:hypothetical protein|nr:hypothetical protein [Thermoanaerobaculia bacterium]
MRILPAVLGASLLATSGASAIVPEIGELQVNTETAMMQRQAAVACAPDGRFVIAWSSATSTGSDQSLDSIQAQRFDANGSPEGGQIQVNVHTTGTQWHPAVAIAANGDWVVAWESETAPSGGDASLASIRMRGFTAAGAELFAERQVNDFTTGAQVRPALAWVGSEIVAAWQSAFSPGDDASLDSIQARRFSSTGAPLAAQFQVNTTTAGPQTAPAIAGWPGFGYVIAWSSDDDPGGGFLFRVRARRFNSTGPLSGELAVDLAPGNTGEPTVAMSSLGFFAVAWQSNGADGDGIGILGRLFDSTGAALGPAFQVNDFPDNDQLAPAIAFLGTSIAVVWQSDGSPGPDVSSHSIQLRLFDGSAEAPAAQEQVNVFGVNAQDSPALAFSHNRGRLVASWESNGSNGTDRSLFSIQATTYLSTPPPGIFQDGFESGNACRWSAGPC